MILPEHEANQLLAAAGIPMIPLKTVDSVDEAKAATASLGYPVVLKLSSSQYTHKTEVGGVCLNLTNEAEVMDAFQRLKELRAQSKLLVTIGACATAGGIQALRNFKDVREFTRRSSGASRCCRMPRAHCRR